MKTYNKPCCTIKEIHLDNLIALSLGDVEADEGTTVLGNGRRGTWGDLWYDASEEE